MKENSIEENIERIAKLITTKFNNDYSIDNVDKEAIEELLKAYKELKEIEENHRKENGELREQVKELEEENKKLKDNYKNQIEHTTILAKALNLEEDASIDEMYAEINKLKTNSIPTSVIQNKIEWLKAIADNGMNAVRFACSKEDEIERMQKQKDINTMINILQEIIEEGRK